MATDAGARRRLLLSGGTIGFGLGAIVDVVLFHLIFQTHHLLSGVYDPYSLDGLRTNVMFDGLFTLGMLAVSGVGLAADAAIGPVRLTGQAGGAAADLAIPDRAEP